MRVLWGGLLPEVWLRRPSCRCKGRGVRGQPEVLQHLSHRRGVRQVGYDAPPAPAMDVQAGTGWHVSELVRFAKMGSVEPYRGEAEGIAGVLVCPQTKSGEPLRTAVSSEVLEAGKRLLERGSFSSEKYVLAIKGACTAAGIPPFTPGRFRHSVATWAIEKGADSASVAAFLNHKSPSTTRRFYATHAVPAKIPTLR